MSVSEYLECPITKATMVDPVSTEDGHTYERAAIQDWFARGNRSSPATGRALGSLTLTPNFLVRQMIAATTAAGAATATMTGAAATATATTVAGAKPFVSVRPHIGGRTFTGKNGKDYIQIQAHMPHDTPLSATGSDYIISIDTSGSMCSISWVKLNDGGSMGISRLDLVKHLVKTILAMLGPEDRMALVAFSDGAYTVLSLTHVTDAGKALLIRELDKLEPNGSTHLYGGIEEAARIASSDTCRGRRIVGMILTDGQPTESIYPVTGGRSTLPVLQERVRVANPWTFHAIGFSSDINSRLLEQVAALWNGRMLFVPSGDMVSTNGINLAAFEKTVVSLGTTVDFVVRKGPYDAGVQDRWSIGPLGVGQRRDFVMEVGPGPHTLELVGDPHPPLDFMMSTAVADCRNDMVETLTAILEIAQADMRFARTPRLDDMLMAFYRRHEGSGEFGVSRILRDVVSKVDGEGQCRLALQHLGSNDWGSHYLRAYRDHMREGVCMNFKDPGLKLFETGPFLEFQRQGDLAFGSIVPPRIHRQGAAAAAVPMGTAFNNSGGSCFEGSMPVRMAYTVDGQTTRAVRDLRRGDLVWTPSGPATVEYAIEFHTLAPSQPMVQLEPQIAVTPWHPYKISHHPTWGFPADHVQYAARPLQTVYNLVLDRGHVIEAVGCSEASYQFVTLGHGFQESPLKHDFFGSKERILDALRKQPGFEEGRPVYKNLVAVQEGGLIVDWTDG